MDDDRRREIIDASLLILHRHKQASSASPAGASAERPKARPASSSSSESAASWGRSESENKWMREAEEFEKMRRNTRGLLKAEEWRHNVAQHKAEREKFRISEDFWARIDQRISAALDTERTWIVNTMRDALVAMTEVVDGTADRFEYVDHKLGELAKLLEDLRAATENSLQQRVKERAERAAITDVPPLRGLVH